MGKKILWLKLYGKKEICAQIDESNLSQLMSHILLYSRIINDKDIQKMRAKSK